MSYIRWGDESDVYVHAAGPGMFGCSIRATRETMPPGCEGIDLNAKLSEDDMGEHLKQIKAKGFLVPDWVVDMFDAGVSEEEYERRYPDPA